jgi:hypothetical protein
MLLAWLDTRHVVEFARSIVAEIGEAMPANEEVRSRKEIDKRARKIERLGERARAFSREHRLNFYQKAKLGNTLKWELKEAGYSEVFVREIVGHILVNL